MARKLFFYVLCLLVIGGTETGCRAKSCPSYLDDAPPQRKKIFKKRKRAKGGRYYEGRRRY